MESSAVTFTNVRLNRGDRNILSDVSLTLPQGKVSVIFGASGSGKTTLLRLITGQLAPDQGHVEVLGHRVDPRDRAGLYKLRTSMGMMFQSSALFPHLTVFDNVAFPVRAHVSCSEQLIRHLVWMKLEAVGLRGVSHAMPAELSGGMARRVALARATVLDPQLLLYDEPLTGQDPISCGVLLTLMRQLNNVLAGTSVIVSHRVDTMMRLADHVVLLGRGEVVAEGSPDALMGSRDPYVVQFMHGQRDGVVPFHVPGPSMAEAMGLSVGGGA